MQDGDMQSGLINKVAVTPVNVTDAQGFKHVCPQSGAVYADKRYCLKPSIFAGWINGNFVISVNIYARQRSFQI